MMLRRSYLLRSGRLDMVQQHMQMSLFCFQYLTGPPFGLVNQDGKAATITAKTGFYGFFDYATAHWDHHLLEYVRQAALGEKVPLTKEGLWKPLCTAWMNFVKIYCGRHNSSSEVFVEHNVPWDTSVQRSVSWRC